MVRKGRKVRTVRFLVSCQSWGRMVTRQLTFPDIQNGYDRLYRQGWTPDQYGIPFKVVHPTGGFAHRFRLCGIQK